ALVKVADPAELQRARELSEAKDAAKRLAKEKEAQLAEEKRLALLEKAKMPPQDMFRTPEMRELYSAWDERGVPTKDAAGEELPKSKAKRLAKELDAQAKLHANYLQYSSIAARALRRVAKAELQTEIAKREGMNVKFAKWSNGKAGVASPAVVIETRPKAEE
ncbi:cysteinyl-tRNA synthetase, partial [Coemansia spiralis]